MPQRSWQKPPINGPEPNAGKNGDIEHPHVTAFLTHRRQISDIGHRHRHDHRRAHPVQGADQDQRANGSGFGHHEAHQAIDEKPADEKPLPPPAVGEIAHDRLTEAPGQGKSGDDYAQGQSSGTQTLRKHRHHGHNDPDPQQGDED